MKKTTAIIGISTWVVLLFSLFITIASASAAEVTMAINPNSTTEPAGYNLYYGIETRKYTGKVDLKSRVRDVPFTIQLELIPGKTYYFAATAYDGTGNESSYSVEVSKLVPNISIPELKDMKITIRITLDAATRE